MRYLIAIVLTGLTLTGCSPAPAGLPATGSLSDNRPIPEHLISKAQAAADWMHAQQP